jgi:hypothetical protein
MSNRASRFRVWIAVLLVPFFGLLSIRVLKLIDKR